jgi:hypothetical protein
MTTFLRCGMQWSFAYVRGIKSPPSLKAVRGIAIHKAAEVDMSQKVHTGVDISAEEMIDTYSDSWTAETANGYTIDDDGTTPGDIKDKGVEMVQLYRDKVAPRIQPVLVEEPIQFEINGQPYSGQIDVAERKKGKLIIRDTKSTARKPDPAQYTLNMVGYAVSQRQVTGEVEADTVLDYLIGTKVPRYLPVNNGGPVSDQEIRRFSTVVSEVAANIKAGRFPPNGLVNGACSWCGYKSICPAYIKKE